MAIYSYIGITSSGQRVSNKVEERSAFELAKRLKNNGIIPISIRKNWNSVGTTNKKRKRNIQDVGGDLIKDINTADLARKKELKEMSFKEKFNFYMGTTERVTTRDISTFTQSLYLLKKANFNNIHAIETIIQSTENFTFRSILEDILAGLQNGEFMYTTMEYYSNVFPFIYINMIKVGELSGSLVNSLNQAMKYMDETDAMNRKLKSILIPNIIEFVALVLMLFAGTIFAIPQIQSLFNEIGTSATLPAVTIWFKGVVDVLMKVWYIPLMIIAAIVGGIIAYVNTPEGKYKFHVFKYTMPLFGKLIFSIDFSRLLKAIKLNLDNGVRIQESLEVGKNVIKNLYMLSMIETAINNIIAGYSWIEPFEKCGIASPMIVEMLKVGMQTDLTEMLEKLIEYMDIDINIQLGRIMKVLPQIVYIVVGIILIFFVIVVLVPCVQLYMGDFLFSAYL